MTSLGGLATHDPLAEARENLLAFLLGATPADEEVVRGESRYLESQLIDANVIVAGNVDVWFELHAQYIAEPAGIHFTLHAVSSAPLPPTAQLIIEFNKVAIPIPFAGEQADHAWTLPERDVIDRKSRRVLGPSTIKLAGV
jgi:hypothetical protein